MSRPPAWFPAPRGKLGAHRTTRAAVDAVLEGLGSRGAALVTADLARSAADLVDSARARQDPRLWLTASARLEDLLKRLGVRDQADPEPEPDPKELTSDVDRMADLVGRPAAVRDEA